MRELSEDELKVERIEAYLTGKLSPKDKAEFEQELVVDQDLQMKVKAYQKLFAGFRAKELEILHQRMQQWETDRTEKSMAGNRAVWYAAAAAVLLLIVSVLFFLPNNGTSDNSELFSQHFQPFGSDLALRNQSADERDSLWQELSLAVEAYQEGQMREAVQILEDKLRSAPPLTSREWANVRLMLGCAYLSLNNGAEALKHFDVVEQDPDYREHGQWYKGLTYLMMEQEDKAVEMFSKLTEIPYYNERAEEILSTLRQ